MDNCAKCSAWTATPRTGGLHRTGVAAVVVIVAVWGAVALAVFVIIIAVVVRAFVERAHCRDTGADPAHYVAVAQFQRVLGELNQLRVERSRERAERAVDDAIKAGKLIPAQREWATSYCQANFKGFAAFAARQPAAFGGAFESVAATFTPPPSARGGTAALTATETAICAQLGLSPEDYLGRKRRGQGDFLRLNRGND